jgi:FkbM family methyltransferase
MNFKFFITGLFRIGFLEKLITFPKIQKSAFNEWIVRKIAPRIFQYKKNTFRKATRNGIHFNLDISQHIEYSIFFNAIDHPTRKKLYSFIKPQDTVLDIGTNIGEVLLNIAKIIGENGFVYGFEPDKETFQRLQKNISLNNFGQLEINNFGLSHKKADFGLYTFLEQNQGANRILENMDSKPKFIVQTVPLDNFVQEKKISKIDLIKIDVEGFEYFVLQGAVNTLEKFKPKLFVELIDEHLQPHNQTARELVNFLNELKYDCFHAETDEEISKIYDLANCKFDIYALPKTQ